MAAPCKICSAPQAMKLVAEMVASGASDQAIADRLGGGISRMGVSRHRRSHILAPARAIATAAAKGQDVAQERAELVAAAEAGDPAAFLTLGAIVSDLRKVHDRLERAADAAETDGQRLAVASLSAQQLRASEVRAKLGGVGGFAPRQLDGMQAGTFSIVINLGDGHTETVSLARPVVDVDVDAERDD